MSVPGRLSPFRATQTVRKTSNANGRILADRRPSSLLSAEYLVLSAESEEQGTKSRCIQHLVLSSKDRDLRTQHLVLSSNGEHAGSPYQSESCQIGAAASVSGR